MRARRGDGGDAGATGPPRAQSQAGWAPKSGSVAVSKLGSEKKKKKERKERKERVYKRQFFPTPSYIPPSLGLGETFTPYCQSGLLTRLAFCPPTSRRGQRVETSLDSQTSSYGPKAISDSLQRQSVMSSGISA